MSHRYGEESNRIDKNSLPPPCGYHLPYLNFSGYIVFIANLITTGIGIEPTELVIGSMLS